MFPMRHLLYGALVAVVRAGNASEAETETRVRRETPIVKAVRKTRPSIVCIKSEKKGTWGKKETAGTGVIVDERGYVVTNCHVVANAERVAVHMYDGTEVPATIFIKDTAHDLAILHIRSEKKLQWLELGPATDLMVGETVIAVGHPYGYTNSVTTGIISALDREITMPTGDTLTGIIQINAGINPGNSGGPLLNINGELIGINVAMREGAQGIAFALNADMVQQVLSRHLSALKMSGLSHGLRCRELVAEEGQERQQVLVNDVVDRSPAAEAGVKRGDAILQVAGRAVANRFDVERALWDMHAGQKVLLTVLRDGEKMKVPMVLSRDSAADAR